VNYYPGENISLSGNQTLYAVWSSAETMSIGSSKTATINFGGQVRYYTYTPSSTGAYTFYSTGDSDTYGYLYNSSGTQLASNDDGGSERNFSITYTLTSGTQYYLAAKIYNSSNTGSFYVYLERSAYTLTYSANGGSNAPSSIDNPSYISSTCPTRFGYTFSGWAERSGGSAAYFPGNSITLTGNKTLYAIWNSAYVVEDGYSYTLTWGSFPGDNRVYYKFTPSASGSYNIYSSGNYDTKVALLNSSGTQLASDDDSGSGYNFDLTYNNFIAGNTYYFMLTHFDDATSGVQFKVDIDAID